MPSRNEFVVESWLEPGQDVFNYWISFFPTAPLFGVEYRFAKMMPWSSMFDGSVAESMFPPMPGTTPAPKPKAKPAPKMAREPEVVEPKPAATPVAVPAEAPVAAEPGKPAGLLSSAPVKADDLKQIKGIGPGLEKQLNALGVYKLAQIAGFGEADLAWVDDNLTSFKGRCFRDDWVGQAKALLG